MSVVTSIIPFGIGCMVTWAYSMYQQHNTQQQSQQQLVKAHETCLELEEEIVRLKREMRICGIKTSSDERSR